MHATMAVAVAVAIAVAVSVHTVGLGLRVFKLYPPPVVTAVTPAEYAPLCAAGHVLDTLTLSPTLNCLLPLLVLDLELPSILQLGGGPAMDFLYSVEIVVDALKRNVLQPQL